AMQPAPAVGGSVASAAPPVTTAMGGPPARKPAVVRPRVRQPEDDDEGAPRNNGCPDGDCSRPAVATGDAQARPVRPRADDGNVGSSP
ncbi:MAG: hypothetical protein H0U68_13080, partial [Ramlibacter sp.]|nr:hypothetical protein [Ramlibacter sp.]